MPAADRSTPSRRMPQAAWSALYRAEHQLSHDERWRTFSQTHPALARHALAQAHYYRELHADPGDAYLVAAAEIFHALNRQQLADELGHADRARQV